MRKDEDTSLMYDLYASGSKLYLILLIFHEVRIYVGMEEEEGGQGEKGKREGRRGGRDEGERERRGRGEDEKDESGGKREIEREHTHQCVVATSPVPRVRNPNKV